MLIKEYRNYFMQELSILYDEGEAESFFYLILEDTLQLKRIDLALNIDLEFSDTQIQNWNAIVEKLQQEIPIQYILGKTNFYGLDFEVNQNVLIPRPETEELVDWIIENQKLEVRSWKAGFSDENFKVLDIGTGSGCIAISLAKNIKEAQVFAIDISENAIEIAEKNKKNNNVSIHFIKTDILKCNDLDELRTSSRSFGIELPTKYDIIVSNPPYIRNLEKAEIKNNVLNNEPHLALFVSDDDALIFYKKIAELAQKNLSKNGQLYFEINQYLGIETVDLLAKMNFKNIELRKDIYGNDRMIRCEK